MISKIILASQSPRRRELLLQIGLTFDVIPCNAPEVITKTEPEEVVKELSYQKAFHVAQGIATNDVVSADGQSLKDCIDTKDVMDIRKRGFDRKEILVIGADTIVSVRGEILGKPKDAEDAGRMLNMLQGNVHQVYTGVTLLLTDSAGNMLDTRVFAEKTEVEFFPMSEQEIEAYMTTPVKTETDKGVSVRQGAEADKGVYRFDWEDKAGAYGIQGMCARYIKGIVGDYNNVVGLPVGRLYQELLDMTK